MQTATAAQVINAAALELGLISADVADPFASTDENLLQLCALLNRLGKTLARDRAWTQLTQEYTFPTVDGTADYALPTDFQRFKDTTAWNRTSALPLVPFNSQNWQMVKAASAQGFVDKPMRIWKNRLYLYPTPSAAETIAFEYVSTYWVVGAGSSPDSTETDDPDDVLWFDEALLVSGLKLLHLRAKGEDWTAAQSEYDTVYRAVSGADGVAPILSAVSSGTPNLIDERNLPETGYGS
jgi:hypothetical protein